MSLTPRSPRGWAYRILETYRETGDWVQDELHRVFATGAIPPQQRGFLTEIVCGVVRRRATLDALLAKTVPRPLAELEPNLCTLLAIGAYQLVAMDHTPSFAAVNETVEVARELGQARWIRFANGVLRGVTRLLTNEFRTAPAPDALPLDESRFRRLAQPVFADPAVDRASYIAAAYSLPSWLTSRWSGRLSDESLFAVAASTIRPPSLWLRVNRLRASREQMLSRLEEQGLRASPGDVPESLSLIDSAAIDDLPGFEAGWFSVQDLTAMRAARLLAPQSGEAVWDVCAAPGTKTTHLAELMGDQGRLLATDISDSRLSRVEQNRNRLGLTCLKTIRIDPNGGDLPGGPFSAILLDAPCSNTGVLHRRPEARWRITPADLIELPQLQRRLLRDAVARLAPQGRLVYSTCSIEPEENEHVVQSILAETPGFELREQHAYLPTVHHDGGYQALLARTGSP